MKLNLFTLILALLFSYCTSAQVLRPMTPRYSNPSVKGNIVFVANNSITSSGVSTVEAPPGGTAVNNGNVAVNIDIDGVPGVTYVAFGGSWKYLANNTRPANWHTSGYNDAAWPSGNGEFGYGDGDETTCVPSGGGGTLCVPTGNKYVTTYFRKTVNIANPASHSTFTLNVKRDDGIAVYVNGVEVYRNNLPAGALAHGTFATNATDNGDVVQSIQLPSATFSAGTNRIAVEVHQTNLTSSDLTFDLELIGNPNTITNIFNFGSTWKYLANNTRPANWNTTGYNDGAWPTGTSEFGYGDGDEVTCIPSGGGGSTCAPTGNKYITTYFRKVVNITNPSSYAYIIMQLVRDDGAVVYVNGVEVRRDNMPGGAIAHSTLATSNVSGTEESAVYNYNIPTSYFVSGNNTIAVEIHQDVASSTDISFNMAMSATTDSTFNSTSANLTLPSCTNVLFAGLYWGATQGNDGTNTTWIQNETAIKLKIPGATNFVNLTSTQTDYHNDVLVPSLPHTGYRCFVDITSLINSSNPNGTYTIANIASPAGIINATGGWTIVIAYSDPATIVRNLTVFDGSVIMNGGDPALHVPITGFLTPPAGAVSCELGAVVFDGDRVSTDEFSFKQNSNPLVGTYTNLTPNATANLNDMWNGTISYKGSVVTTRNPAHQNTLGYDADIIEVPNPANAVLGNSQSSASIRFSSPSENYMIQVATTAISQYTPTFSMSKVGTDANGGSLTPGDPLEYTINYQNTGNDASIGTVVSDRIPVGTSYRPGSIVINGVAKTDAAGDDEAEYDFANNRVVFRIGTGASSSSGGEIPVSGTGSMTFQVYTASSCAAFTCSNVISNSARIDYAGKISLINLYDSSGVLSSGCNVPGPASNTLVAPCFQLPEDTLLTNICPATTVLLPMVKYAGYQFYTSTPFTLANRYDPGVPVTFSRTIFAYYDGAGSCNDTVRINVSISACPDIDDDNDGIPDYVEINNPVALQDHDLDNIPNWNDNTYPGYIDNNLDGVNDNFDPSADSDNDGVPNFSDPNFAGFVDANGDGVNDSMDRDRDGIPNHLDVDSDNDGIPDVVESLGADADGDGRIDSYTDTDNDGLSQNVDGSNSGVSGSGIGLGLPDLDGDGIPNYFDLDSDNDGIPDVREVLGTDANNDGMLDNYIDSDFDGLSDSADGDVGNDGTAENSANALLRTGADINADGRADSYPYKNFDSDSKANPYELDSDGDGITDVREAGFVDADNNGQSDGVKGADGWDDTIDALVSLTVPNSDGDPNLNFLDIDADDDGIPDNVEGMSTSSYQFPLNSDTDGDGIDNRYDNIVGFGGNGITPNNQDGDGLPDYIDGDTDNDGSPDVIEGNDFNLNGQADDNPDPLGTDTDGDGLDDRFDANNSSIEGTSQYMGTLGSLTGDPTPGSITMVQKRNAANPDRDWRHAPFILDVSFLELMGNTENNVTNLRWIVTCNNIIDHFEIERSTNGINFSKVGETKGIGTVCNATPFIFSEMASGSNKYYYRIKAIGVDNSTKRSQILVISKQAQSNISVSPNPATHYVNISCNVPNDGIAEVVVFDASGKAVIHQYQKVFAGSNTFSVQGIDRLTKGIYTINVQAGPTIARKKLMVKP